MIEVIGEDSSKKLEKTCWNCSSKLRFTRSDTEKFSHTDYTGCTEVYVGITCPRCRAIVKV